MSIDPAPQLTAHGVAYAPQIAAAATKHGLDPALLAAVAAQETGGPGTNAGRNVVGGGGHGHGVFQIDDRWHTFAQTAAAMDPGENADYAAGMLSGLLSRYGGNVHQALSAYNAGSPDAVGTRTLWPGGQSLGYADSVLQHYALITGSPGPVAEPATGTVPALPQGSPSEAAASSEAEIETLLSALTGLQSQAQSLPYPSSPQTTQQPYQPQAIDYGSLLAPDADN